MSVSKYISIWFSSVLSWEWEALWSAPVPTFLPTPSRWGLLFHVSSAGRLSTGTLGLSEPRVSTKPLPNRCVAACLALAYLHPVSISELAEVGRRFTQRGPGT